jgi:two-component system response regulator FlrC
MHSSSTQQQTALWLDPFRTLSASESALLVTFGLCARVVNTLDDLQDQLPQAHLLVIRLAGSTELLCEVQSLMKNMGFDLPVICRVERKSLEIVVSAMQQGARYVLDADDWSASQWQSAQKKPVVTGLQATPPMPVQQRAPAPRSVVYVDPASRNLLALAQKVAQANVTVLLEGPTGSGKEVLARVLHESSPCATGPFVGLNCAAMPELMIEDMLFGHEKGAFTGALKEHKGLFEQAQGGTLFLDEITEMPIHLQAKLLRVLQERSLMRLGGERLIALDVRVIAATNKNLRDAIAHREFREDLYFRLSTFKLRVPKLQERPGDILPLVARLLARHASEGQAYRVNAQAQAFLLAYPWPGNVRELENVMLRAMVLCPDHIITHEHLMFDDAPPVATKPVNPQSWMNAAQNFVETDLSTLLPAGDQAQSVMVDKGLHAGVKTSEQRLIQAALETTVSRNDAAKKLGISPRTLRYKLAKLKVSTPELATSLEG